MKKITTVLAVLALSCAGLHAQSTNAVALPAPPPLARPVQSVSITLTAAQTAAFIAALGTVVTPPANTQIVGGSFRVNAANGTSFVTAQIKPTAPITTQ